MNFQPIAFVDCWEVAGSLYGGSRMGLFRKDAEPRTLPLRGPRPSADDPEDDAAFINYLATLGKWAEMKRLLQRLRLIARPVIGEVDLGLVYLERLEPGQILPWTLEDSAYNTRFARLHLPIRTNPGALIYAGPETRHIFPGEAVVVNQRVRHAAANWGETARIHLIVDFKPKEASE